MENTANVNEQSNEVLSPEEIEMRRKEAQAEALLSTAFETVTKTYLEVNNKSDVDEEVKNAVDKIMASGMNGVMKYLSQHGKSLPVPADRELQVRNMIRQKLIFLHQFEHRPLPGQVLDFQVNQIMQLPKPRILDFLEQSAKKFNWVLDSKDSWADLPKKVQQAASALGYDEEIWNDDELPDECDKFWEDLSPLQKQAATFLGYTQPQWDGAEGAPLKNVEDMKNAVAAIMNMPRARYYGSSDEGSWSSADSQEVPDAEHSFRDYNAEVHMMQKIRELITYKMQRELSIDDPNDDVLQRAVNEIMNLPKLQIKEFLHRPLLPAQQAQTADDSESSDNDDESDSEETGETDEEAEDEAEDEFLSNFLEDEAKTETQQESVATAEETESSESNAAASQSSKSGAKKQIDWPNQLDTFVSLWAFNPEESNDAR